MLARISTKTCTDHVDSAETWMDDCSHACTMGEKLHWRRLAIFVPQKEGGWMRAPSSNRWIFSFGNIRFQSQPGPVNQRHQNNVRESQKPSRGETTAVDRSKKPTKLSGKLTANWIGRAIGNHHLPEIRQAQGAGLDWQTEGKPGVQRAHQPFEAGEVALASKCPSSSLKRRRVVGKQPWLQKSSYAAFFGFQDLFNKNVVSNTSHNLWKRILCHTRLSAKTFLVDLSRPSLAMKQRFLLHRPKNHSDQQVAVSSFLPPDCYYYFLTAFRGRNWIAYSMTFIDILVYTILVKLIHTLFFQDITRRFLQKKAAVQFSHTSRTNVKQINGVFQDWGAGVRRCRYQPFPELWVKRI